MDTNYLKSAPPFSALTDEERQELAARMRSAHYRQDEVIFTQDNMPEAVYLIKSGWVKLTDRRGNSHTVLANLGAGSLIGEMDLFLERPHSTTAYAASPAELWELSRSDLEEVITRNPVVALKLSRTLGFNLAIQDRYLINHRLKVIPPFDNLPEAELNAMAREFKLEQYQRGEVICHADEPAETMYLIEAGSAHLSTQNDTSTLIELDAGDLFGEMALLTSKPYAFTAQTADDVYLWTLSRVAFDRLAERYPFIRVAFSRALSENLGEAEQKSAVEWLQRLKLFESLPPDALKSIAEHLVVRFVPRGEWIYTDDMFGDAMYLIESGQVKIVPNTRLEREVLQTLRARDFFGEMALLLGQPRTDAVKAVEDTTLWILYKRDFDDLLTQYPAISFALNRLLSERLSRASDAYAGNPLRNLRLFADLPDSQLADIAQYLRPARYRAGEIVCAEDTRGDTMYFIETGEAHVTKETARGSLFFANVGPGDIFGEMALLTNGVRSATVQAMTDMNVWSLVKSDLDVLMGKYPEIMLRLNRILSQRLADTAEYVTRHRAERPPQYQTPPRARPAYGYDPYYAPRRGEVTATYAASRRGYGMPSPTPPPPRDYALSNYPYRPPERVEPQVPLMDLGQMFQDALRWFNGLTWSAKLRLALVTVLSGWIFGVSAPALVVSALPDDLGLVALAQVSAPMETSFPLVAAVVKAEGNREPEIVWTEKPLEMPAPTEEVVEVAQPTYTPQATYTPFPTYTPPPPTATPIPPTATLVPTDTPVPTAEPTDTPRPRPTRVPPTATPIPEPTNTPIPEVPRFWDPKMPGGISLQEAAVQSGQTYWKLVSAKFLDVDESNMRHHTYVNVLDEAGNKIIGEPVSFAWADGEEIKSTEQKQGDEFSLNFAMYANIGSYTVGVEGLSDKVAGLGLIAKHHISYELIFQRVVAP